MRVATSASSEKRLSIREEIEHLNKRGKLKVILAEGLDRQPTAFVLPGRGRPTNEKPFRPTEDDSSNS
jgi:hypothetical protein